MEGSLRVDFMTERITRYINKRLRDDKRIVDWAFYIYEGNTLIVVIDYICDYHSRLQIPMNGLHDYDETRMWFDHYMTNYFHELEELTKEKEKE